MRSNLWSAVVVTTGLGAMVYVPLKVLRLKRVLVRIRRVMHQREVQADRRELFLLLGEIIGVIEVSRNIAQMIENTSEGGRMNRLRLSLLRDPRGFERDFERTMNLHADMEFWRLNLSDANRAPLY